MTHQTTFNSLALGALGGVIASIAMYPFLYLTTSMIGIPLDDLSIARGMALSNSNDNYYVNLFLGISMHVFTGAISGMIFIVIITMIKKFKINSFKKGITEGVIYSLIIFIVLFIPTTMIMVQPNLYEIMKQSNPTQSNLEDRQTIEQNLFPIYGFGLVAHIIFGVALGVITSLLIWRGNMILNK